jgi:hypothetical protein
MSKLTLYSNRGGFDVVMDAGSLRVVEPVYVVNEFDGYDGYSATWELDPSKMYVFIRIFEMKGGDYDVWACLGKVPEDNAVACERRYHFWARSVSAGVGKALRAMRLLRDDEVWLPLI